jgi:hypothetical protein
MIKILRRGGGDGGESNRQRYLSQSQLDGAYSAEGSKAVFLD